MFTTSIPISEATVAAPSGEAVATLLDNAPQAGRELPCRRDPDLWFAEQPSELERAKALCADCPVKSRCLAGALDRQEPWGVWGGEIFERGTVVARKRPRGRPRKHPVPERSKATVRSKRETAA